MNLDFKTVKTVKVDNIDYYLQKADVTVNKDFWVAWKYAKRIEAEAKELNTKLESKVLTSILTLAQVNSTGKATVWYAYRLLPRSKELPMGKFALSYVLRDRSKLLPYQPEAVALICNSIVCNGAAIDGSDCGIGKTYHAVATARELNLRPAIIARKSGLTNWQRICNQFGLSPLFISSWESAKTGKFEFAKRTVDLHDGKYKYEWKVPKNTLLIFDEAHMACNDDSQNYALWQASKGRASISLSATFADRPSRLKGLLNILGITTPEKFDEWLQERGHFVNQYNDNESLSPIDDMKEINRILYPRFGCRLTDDHPEVRKFFPEAKYATEVLYIGKKAQDIQNKLYGELLEKILYYKSLGQQTKAFEADLRYRQATELLKINALIDLIESFRSQGKAVCVFVNFKHTLKFLALKLKTRSLIFGDQERYKLSRQGVIDDFQTGKTDIVLSMLGAGGQSISLHDINGKAPRVSLICPTYDPIALAQVFGRTHRSGSKSKPIIKLVYAAGTIEEKVAQKVNEKINNIKALMDGDLMEPDLFNIIPAKERISIEEEIEL